jgi:hypothetical protein
MNSSPLIPASLLNDVMVINTNNDKAVNKCLAGLLLKLSGFRYCKEAVKRVFQVMGFSVLSNPVPCMKFQSRATLRKANRNPYLASISTPELHMAVNVSFLTQTHGVCISCSRIPDVQDVRLFFSLEGMDT